MKKTELQPHNLQTAVFFTVLMFWFPAIGMFGLYIGSYTKRPESAGDHRHADQASKTDNEEPTLPLRDSKLPDGETTDQFFARCRPLIEQLPDKVDDAFDQLSVDAKVIACLWALEKEQDRQWSFDFN